MQRLPNKEGHFVRISVLVKKGKDRGRKEEGEERGKEGREWRGGNKQGDTGTPKAHEWCQANCSTCASV